MKNLLSKYVSMKVHGILFVIYTILLIVWQVLVGNSLITESTSNLHAEYFYDSFWEMIWIVIGFTLKQLLPGSQKSADYPYQAFKRSF